MLFALSVLTTLAIPVSVACGFCLTCHVLFGNKRYQVLTLLSLSRRLRQTDVKAGHFERKVQALESERDQWESKYEEMAEKYSKVQKELEEFQLEIGNI